MGDEAHAPNAPRRTRSSAIASTRNRLDARLLGLLVGAEHVLLYLVSVVLLAVGGGIAVLMCYTVVQSRASWTEKIIIVLEDLLLVLIVLEIFVTVLTHLEGGRLQLEPFIIVGIIAVVRHILSVVVRLTVSMTAAESREQFTEMAVYGGVAFLLTAALAVARWSERVARQEP